MSIRTKLVVAFLLAVSVAMGSAVALVYWKTSASSLDDSKAVVHGQLLRVNNYIEVFFRQIQENARFLASSPQVVDSYEHLIHYLSFNKPTTVAREAMNPQTRAVDMLTGHMRDTHPVYSGIFVGFDNARYTEYPTAEWPVGWDPRVRPWYNSTLQGVADVNISPAYSTPQGMAVCAVTSKIFRDGKGVGVLGIDIKLESIVNMVTGIRLGGSGYIMLMEKNGMVLADARKKDLVYKKITESNVQALKDAYAMESGSIIGDIDGRARLITVLTGYNGWKLLGIMDMDEVRAPSRAISLSILYIGMGVAVLLILLSVLLAGSISRPIRRMVELSREIADGRTAKLPPLSGLRGEMGVLYVSLSDMVHRLSDSVAMAESKSSEAERQARVAEEAFQEAERARTAAEKAQHEGIVQTAEQLEAMIRRIGECTRAVRSSAVDVQTKARAQHDRATETSVAVGQMNIAVLEVAHSAANTARNVENARENAEHGGQLVTSVEKSIDEVARVSRQLDTQLSTLGERAQDISRIMIMISDVADQTNLLALNAAIEAARAGEAGRGFAVVADEVRKLAETTMSATGEVGTVVKAIRAGADASIRDMNDVTGHIEVSRALATEAKEALHNIVAMVQESSDQVRSIATASEEQSASSSSITHTVEAVSALSSDIVQAMIGATDAVKGLVGETEQIEQVIQQLKR